MYAGFSGGNLVCMWVSVETVVHVKGMYDMIFWAVAGPYRPTSAIVQVQLK
jgi:hypothetical protein